MKLRRGNMLKGNIHSVETFGSVDGPGVRFLPCKGLSRGIDAGIYPALFRLTHQLGQKVKLHKRLAAAHRDSALVAPIGAVALGFVDKLGGGVFLTL